MRDYLKNLTEKDYWVYGISEHDFDHVVELVREMIDARSEQYERYAKQVREKDPDVADELLDDVEYYRFTDNQYLWQFALLRLQGLIEAVITYQLIKKEKMIQLPGLKSKLTVLKKQGYSVSNEEFEELLLWAKLRNAISHAPPEQFRPVFITEQDIVEYSVFLKNLCVRWLSEKEDKKGT